MFKVFQDAGITPYGSEYSIAGGVTGVRGSSSYRHRFGGTSWGVVDPNPVDTGPTLLLTIDLTDPLLGRHYAGRMDEFPLCSYLARDVWAAPQMYRIDAANRVVTLVHRSDPVTDQFDPEFSGPLDEIPLKLEVMPQEDRPETEDMYINAID